ncbi:MAG: Crp/Fnr family transcriptional regulator [Prevotellaceae bacterium]|nr:Crp/Fnr family transcriptional regulator [Prevotellaceae bacterium]
MVNSTNLTTEEITHIICNIWGPVTYDQEQLISENITIENYTKGEIIYKELEHPKDIFCLIQGKVKIHKEGISRRSQIVRVIRPVEMFGFRAYFAHQDYETAALAIEKSIVARIPLELVVQLIKENSNISLYLINQLAIRLGDADRRTISLTQKHIRGRLAEAILFLKKSYGLEEDGCTLSIYLSREEMANLSNMTTSNAIRTLSAFAEENLIAIDGRKVKLINEKGLISISQKG